MKKKLFFALLIAASQLLVLTSCSSDEEPTKLKWSYKFKFSNSIDTRYIDKTKADGNLYDVCIVANNGKAYKVGNIINHQVKEYVIQEESVEDLLVASVVVKIGRNAEKAEYEYYWTPEKSTGVPVLFTLRHLEEGTFRFTENTTYSSLKYRTFEQLEEWARTLKNDDYFATDYDWHLHLGGFIPSLR